MFFRKRRHEKEEPTPPDELGGQKVPQHVGDVWQILQSIASEEDPSWNERNIVSYYHQGAEAQKDILRWLAIYQKRVDPDHEFAFPEHHPRHRGYCLIPRHWPTGTRWEAFCDEEWTRANVPPQQNRESLEQALDELIDETPFLHRSHA